MLPVAQVMEILECISDALYTLDEHWHITYVNGKTEEIWGRCRADLLGCNVWAVFPQAVGTAAYDELLGARQEHRSVTFEHFSPVVHRWFDVRAYPNGTGLIVHFSDITARKQAEAACGQQQELLQTIFDQIPVMIRLLDAEGRVQLVNRAWERTLGWSLAEVQQHNLALFEQLYPDPQERQRALAFVATATGEWADFRLRTRHGQVIDTTFANLRLANGTNLSIGQDITARKRTEEALRASEERFRRYFEMGLVGMAITSPTQTWLEVNDELCAILGYERQELVQMTWAELTHPDDLATDVSLFNQILAGEMDGYALDKRFIRKDGQVIHASIAVKCMRRADGTIEYFTGLLQDITARKAAEAAEREQHQFAAALRDSLAALTGSLTVERVMQQILEAAAIVVPSAAGSIILFEGEYGHVAYLRGFTPEAQAYFKDYWFPIADLANKHVLANKQPYFVPDTQTAYDWIPIPGTAWIRSSIGIPITMRGEVIGLLIVDSDTPHYFQPSDLEKLQAFAHYAGLALENAEHVNQLEQKVMARTAELNDAKERVEGILNNSPDGILLVHADLRIEQTNAAFHRLFASPPTDAYFGSLYDLIHTDDIARVQLVIETALQEQAGQPVEMRCYRKNGTVFDADLSISSITAAVTGTARLVCTIRDITERKQVQTALAEERNLLRTLIDTLPDSIYIKDTAHRTVLCNLAGARAVGVTPEETIGQDNFAFFPAEMARQFQAEDDQLFQS
ncbi:MAG: PAS domain S-box protein, partial [Chloroflexi bacterium]|nr:PAS domain S-box protein [Chloroflexota bacterium]